MTDHDHVSDLRWDRMFAGELASADQDAARDHAASCTRCAARLRELEADRAAFVLRPRALPASAPAKPRRWRWLAPLGAIVVAATVLLVVMRRHDGTEGERPKGTGQPALQIAAGPAGQLAVLASHDHIVGGDHLQATYTAAEPGFGAVLSIDGAGHASTYVPSSGAALVALPAGTGVAFPESTVLDDVLGRETLAIVWCVMAEPIAPLLEELRTTRSLAKRDGCTVRIVELDKVAK